MKPNHCKTCLGRYFGLEMLALSSAFVMKAGLTPEGI